MSREDRRSTHFLFERSKNDMPTIGQKRMLRRMCAIANENNIPVGIGISLETKWQYTVAIGQMKAALTSKGLWDNHNGYTDCACCYDTKPRVHPIFLRKPYS